MIKLLNSLKLKELVTMQSLKRLLLLEITSLFLENLHSTQKVRE